MIKKKNGHRKAKPLALPVRNIRHEDYAPLIEKAFKSGTVQYYKFIDDKMLPAGRYKYVYAALKEADLRMTLETLQEFIKIIKTNLEGGIKKQSISMELIWRAVINMESRVALGFEPASVKRLAAILYFDETEDLTTYNRMHGMKKVQHWERNGTNDFFLTKPIVELFGLSGISTTSLEGYIQEREEIIQLLTEDLRTLSSESSSGSGKNPL